MQKLTLLLLVLLIWLQYSLWLGKNSIRDLLLVKNDIKKYELNNTNLKIRNKKILYELNDLKTGNDAIEEYSRNDLGMIRQGETFYRFR